MERELQQLLGDDAVTDIMINGGAVWVERAGRLERTSVCAPPEAVRSLVDRALGALGRRADRASPCADGRLPDGSRIHVVLPPVAIDGAHITIRRFRKHSLVLSDFGDERVAGALAAAVRSRRNVVVCGATGSGKTTLLNALCAEVVGHERIITIEDAAELRLACPHVVRLEARPPNAEGIGEITMRDLVRNALRMRPDRLVIGEVRGAEAFDMVQAMNTGHSGSMSTCHANGVLDALRRLEAMVLMADAGWPLDAVRRQLASAVDLMVMVERGGDGSRSVSAIARPRLIDGQWTSDEVDEVS